MIEFLKKYPLATHELLHFPLMYPDSLKKFRIPGIPYVSLDFLYDFASTCNISQGTIRTTLSRMKKEGMLKSETTDSVSRYKVSSLQLEVMGNVQKRKKIQNKGFIVAVYSFEKNQEKERGQARSLLQYCGFVRFAQNAYVNISVDESELRRSLKEYGISDNVFLFNVKTINSDEMGRLVASWKIPQRVEFLAGFYRDVKELIQASDGSDQDIFYRIGIAWVAYIIHVHSTEPPLPDSLFPAGYAYSEIYSYLNRISANYGRQMIRYWKSKNRIS